MASPNKTRLSAAIGGQTRAAPVQVLTLVEPVYSVAGRYTNYAGRPSLLFAPGNLGIVSRFDRDLGGALTYYFDEASMELEAARVIEYRAVPWPDEARPFLPENPCEGLFCGIPTRETQWALLEALHALRKEWWRRIEPGALKLSLVSSRDPLAWVPEEALPRGAAERRPALLSR